MPASPASKSALEGFVIVLSILLAFAIDAGWDARAQKGAIAEQVRQLHEQMVVNAEGLPASAASLQRSLEAQQQLVRLISPTPGHISADSLAVLFVRAFSVGEPTLELGAMTALLSEHDVTDAVTGDLLRPLIRFQAGVDRSRSDGEIYRRDRADVITYLSEIAPGSFISAATGSHEPSDFPVPVERVLSDARLEGLVGNLVVTSTRILRRTNRLQERADTIVRRTTPAG